MGTLGKINKEIEKVYCMRTIALFKFISVKCTTDKNEFMPSYLSIIKQQLAAAY
jgi:hypothetical protein